MKQIEEIRFKTLFLYQACQDEDLNIIYNPNLFNLRILLPIFNPENWKNPPFICFILGGSKTWKMEEMRKFLLRVFILSVARPLLLAVIPRLSRLPDSPEPPGNARPTAQSLSRNPSRPWYRLGPRSLCSNRLKRAQMSHLRPRICPEDKFAASL